MKDIAILITTFLRDRALSACIESVRQLYKDIPIYVADCGNESNEKDALCSEYNCTRIRVPFDAGVCAMRNEAMRHIAEKFKYIVILEDDIVFNNKTRLEKMRTVLEKRSKIGIVGCEIKRVRQYSKEKQNYEATLRIEDDTIFLEKVKPLWRRIGNIRFFYCDIVINVFMMRRAIWDLIKWDENYKTTPEHTDFFLMVKYNTDWKVAFTDSVQIEHHDQSGKDIAKYLTQRTRTFGYHVLAKKWGVKYYWNSWHPKWGIENPMGLFHYAKVREDADKKIQKREVKVVKKDGQIAVGVKTFFRESSLFKTIDSIKAHFTLPYRIYVADDGNISNEKEFRYFDLKKEGHKILHLPFNSGISVGRNAILKESIEDYILIMDDDIMLVDTETIPNMKKVLDSDPDIGLCSGMLYQENGEPFGNQNYIKGLDLKIEDNGLLYRFPCKKERHKIDGIGYLFADQVVNFFLAKREIFDSVKWDNRIKVEYEHMDFFLRLMQTKWKAVTCLNTKATHCRQVGVESFYNQHRRSAPLHYFYGKHGIKNIINRFG